jgi:transposase-like protein
VIGDGLSISQVAEKVGVSRQTLHAWLRAMRPRAWNLGVPEMVRTDPRRVPRFVGERCPVLRRLRDVGRPELVAHCVPRRVEVVRVAPCARRGREPHLAMRSTRTQPWTERIYSPYGTCS